MKEKLLGPNFKLENILPPTINLNTKGRKPNTKRLSSAVEIYENDMKKRDAKKIRTEKAAEKRQDKLEKLQFVKEQLTKEKEIIMIKKEM